MIIFFSKKCFSCSSSLAPLRGRSRTSPPPHSAKIALFTAAVSIQRVSTYVRPSVPAINTRSDKRPRSDRGSDPNGIRLGRPGGARMPFENPCWPRERRFHFPTIALRRDTDRTPHCDSKRHELARPCGARLNRTR